MMGNPAGQFTKRFSFLMRSRNVQKYQFIRTFSSITRTKFNRITGIAQVNKIGSLYGSSVFEYPDRV